ncbi:MAG: hypothetical protein ACUVQ8_00230 [Nitrososphaeria archaeon]
MSTVQNKIRDIKRRLIEEFGDNPSILVGCRTSKWSWPVCGHDVIVFTNSMKGYQPKVLGDDIVNIYFHPLSELEVQKNYELRTQLPTGFVINDPDLSLASYRNEIAGKSATIFSEAYEDRVLRLLSNLTYAEEAYRLQSYASSAFWILCLGYEITVALNFLGKIHTSPSHLMQQVRENTIFKEANYFVDVANFLGLEYATTTSYKRIFSTLETFQEMTDFYGVKIPQSMSAQRISGNLSNIRLRELYRKCEYALEQKMPLNAHIISVKWFTDSTVELYQTVCSTENISQFKPKIIDELEKRRKNLIPSSASLPTAILQEINPIFLRRNIEEARKVVYWLKRAKTYSL